MISKREWYAALRRMLKRAALVFGGLFLMAAFFYWRVFDLRLEAALLATLSAALTGYGIGMMGWSCCLVSWLKAAWKSLVEAAERQRNYWDGDDP